LGKWCWVVAVPNRKPVHIITGTNWEGIEVKSDTAAGKGEGVGDAKGIARRLAMRHLRLEIWQIVVVCS
jgi:hypothetical protein